jgi:hypothetical protein
MSKTKCPYCGCAVKKFGKTAAGSQRWCCKNCKATFTHHIDNTAKLLTSFLKWLLSGKRQCDMPGGGRTFRRKMAAFWRIWPLASKTGEIYRVVFVDGIYLARSVVILIACTETHIIGWHLARSESSSSWGALMSRIAPPEVVICDGGNGFEKARRSIWKKTRVQRCVFHAFLQVKKQTTTRPNLQAGVELYGLAKELLNVLTVDAALKWIEAYSAWCSSWYEFLSEKTYGEDNKHWEWTHARLVTAKNGLDNLIKKNLLFTFLDPELTKDGPLPRMNNRLEGGVNAQLRQMLRDHRGLSLMRRAKAVFWWCYMHTESPLPAAVLLKTMPTDDDIEALYRELAYEPQRREGPAEWGDGLVWSELRHSLPWRVEWG